MKGTPEEKADCLNSVFAAQCSAPTSSTKPRLPPNNTLAESFFFAHIEQSSVLKRLSTLNVWKACGNDGIPNRFLKECAAAFLDRTADTHFQSLSLQSGQFPDQWKKGAITPLLNTRILTAIQLAIVRWCFSHVSPKFWRTRQRATAKSLPESKRYTRRTIRFSAKEVYRVATLIRCGRMGPLAGCRVNSARLFCGHGQGNRSRWSCTPHPRSFNFGSQQQGAFVVSEFSEE